MSLYLWVPLLALMPIVLFWVLCRRLGDSDWVKQQQAAQESESRRRQHTQREQILRRAEAIFARRNAEIIRLPGRSREK